MDTNSSLAFAAIGVAPGAALLFSFIPSPLVVPARRRGSPLGSVVAACAVGPGLGDRPLRETERRSLQTAGRQVGALAVTGEAPAHGQRRDLRHAVHLLDGAVAALASDARE